MITELVARANAPLGPVGEFSAVGWYSLLAGAGALILLGAGAIAYFQQRRLEPRPPPTLIISRAERAQIRAELTDMARESARLTATARLAAAAAQQARTQREVADRALENAERAYDTAQSDYRSAATAALDRESPNGNGKVVDAGTEREIAQAALGAYRRGDITVEDLRRVWFTASGWDAGREQVEHDLLRRRSAELAARRAYHMAVTTARIARRAEEISEVAAKALQSEATAAAIELARAQRAERHRNL